MTTRQGVAVVGLDCRFPGAPDAPAFWRLLMAAAEAGGRAAPGRRGGRPAGYIDDEAAFDHGFFAIDDAEAAGLDPRQRLLLQAAWRALEDAGLPPLSLAGRSARDRDRARTGVYVATMGDEWGGARLADPGSLTARSGTGTGHAMLANRLSYQLDLRGPSLTVDTACSSSLVAVHLACSALLLEECDIAVVAGVNILVGEGLDRIYERAGLAAGDGRCKPFAAGADGIGRAEGVGVVVLRRLADAGDGPTPYAVIRGSAINQDGRSNGMTAPSRPAQRDVIESACHRAGVDLTEVGFVEAHGTGTQLGDLIEAGALGDTYGKDREEPCAIGSVKANIGHAEGAAGMAGLIKTVLALHHRVLPPGSRPGTAPGPRLDLARRGLRLVDTAVRLPDGPVHAGVSSFGMGGSNAHIVLSTAVGAPDDQRPELPSSAKVFTLTADNPEALRRNLLAQADALEELPPALFGRACWSSNTVRTGLRQRFAVAAEEPLDAARQLREAARATDLLGYSASFGSSDDEPSVALVFSGEGTQRPLMGADLYRTSPGYRAAFDEVAKALEPYLPGTRELLLERDVRMHQTAFSGPALFALQYALTGMVSDLGVRPVAVLGHGCGEFAAACAAGALSLDDAARLVTARATLLQALPSGGGMLAVPCRARDMEDPLSREPSVAVAAVNGPRALVLSGSLAALERIAARLRGDGVECEPLRVQHAHYSPLARPAREAFEAVAASVRTGTARLPFYSTVRGADLAGRALDGAYWADQLTSPVRFAKALSALYESQRPTHLLEMGPGPALSPLIHRVLPLPREACLTACDVVGGGGREPARLAAALFGAGLDPRWEELYAPGERTAHRLPPHTFSTSSRFPYEIQPRGIRGHEAHGMEGTAAEPVSGPGGDGGAPGDMACAVQEAVASVLGRSTDDVTDQDRFYEDLGFDSVMLMELRHRLEERLPGVGELSLPDMLAALTSVESLTEYLRSRSAAVAV
ncbi:type I polyketide synthase [Wenjunlia tyrosinilytica]|uniref:Polyketide synthase n=1 Tax=Wenjunlia tyrosinilytica TaxID=1544741 RepID=A0A917ZPR8_9ACTN|nr:type I polyketide synthase [Wenjunlia tyrosinilytica]GGO89035.1 putative polyketide synthase [Wenjunlia tyrosinilytica]